MKFEIKEMQKDEWVVQIQKEKEEKIAATKNGDVLKFKTKEEAESSLEMIEVYESYRERFEEPRKKYTGEELKKRAIEKLKNMD